MLNPELVKDPSLEEDTSTTTSVAEAEVSDLNTLPNEKLREEFPADSVVKNEDVATTSGKVNEKVSDFGGTDQFHSNTSPNEKLREKFPADSLVKKEDDIATTSGKVDKKHNLPNEKLREEFPAEEDVATTSGKVDEKMSSPNEKLREEFLADSVVKNEDVATTSGKVDKKQQPNWSDIKRKIENMDIQELKRITLDEECRADNGPHFSNSQQSAANYNERLLVERSREYVVKINSSEQACAKAFENVKALIDVEKELQEKLKVTQENRDDLRKRNAELEQFNCLQGNQFSKKVHDLEEKNKSQAATITLLEKKGEQQRVALENLEAKLDKAVAERNAAIAECAAAKTECAAAKTECAAAVTTRDNGAREVMMVKAQMDVAQVKMNGVQSQLVHVNAERETASKQLAATTAERDHLKSEVITIRGELNAARRNLADYDAMKIDLAKLKPELDLTKSQLITMTAERDSAIRERNTACEQIRQMVAERNGRQRNTAAVHGVVQEGVNRMRAISNRHASANRHASGSYDINLQYDDNVFYGNQNR